MGKAGIGRKEKGRQKACGGRHGSGEAQGRVGQGRNGKQAARLQEGWGRCVWQA